MALVFVTGGSGFIGRALIERLIDEGHAVRALARSDAAAETVRSLGARPVRGELTNPDSWDDALCDVAAVFHLAAETDVLADRSRHEQVTVEGTRALVEMARQAGVSRFVLCGSEAALLAGDPLVEIDETAPLRPDSEAAYSAAKAASEAIVLGAGTTDFATVSIRPRFVWGPGSVVTDGLVDIARGGRFGWIEGGQQITDVTFVGNAVEGLILGWKRGHSGQAYFVTDQHRVVFRDFMQTVFDIYGVDGEIPELDREEAVQQFPIPFSWFLGQECTLRTDKAVVELAYTPVVSQEAGLTALRHHVASV
ncbi:NAD-dependent epimerase/dehydratase family protein [Streptomyces misionensis]|uniref:NAD-dependent epimerase/dehydratase family protein n=1 Tax=Streptomyces misionensis TaxID=67331 RepID=UPI0033E25D36